MLVPVLRVTLDLSFEINHRVKRAATNRLTVNWTEPDLDLIEPRSVGGRVVNMKASSARKPSLNPGMLVSSVVVHDQMHIELFGHASLDVAQVHLQSIGRACRHRVFQRDASSGVASRPLSASPSTLR